VIARRGESALILTNKHVAPDAARVWVVAADRDGHKRRYDAKFLAANAGEADLALVVADLPTPAVRLAARGPADGDLLRHFGKATGPQEGKVVRRLTYATPERLVGVQTATLSVVGDSGAGMVNARGELCGVLWGSEVKEAENSLSCPVEFVRPFLKRYAAGWGDW
jgi:S1-C subfamily serine protease